VGNWGDGLKGGGGEGEKEDGEIVKSKRENKVWRKEGADGVSFRIRATGGKEGEGWGRGGGREGKEGIAFVHFSKQRSGKTGKKWKTVV
jgi:hypothetical protein